MRRFNINTNRSGLGLRHKLTVYFIGFCALMLACLWIMQIVFLENIYTQIKLTQVENCAELISETIKEKNGTAEIVENISQKNEISVYIYDTSDGIIAQRYSSEYMNPLGKTDLELSNVYNYYSLSKNNNGAYKSIEEVARRGDFFKDIKSKNDLSANSQKSFAKNVVYSEIITIEEDVECFVIVAAMISPVSSVISTLRAQLVVITVVFFFIAAILALFVSRRISKPLATINSQVKELAKQNYNVEFNSRGYQEVSELSDTLNFTKNELMRVNVLQQELIANISHDLRTPLTMITGYAEVMRDLPNENNPENLQVIIDESNRLSSLVNDMLDLSKIKSGTTQLQIETYNLTESIRDIFNRYTKLIQQDGYHIQFIADKEIFVAADQIKIGQVIYNFINNAINHCGPDKKVDVIQKAIMGKVKIEVIDYGDGIEADKLAHIWDRYYKVDKHHNRGVIGTGLGLSIVKRILDMHCAKYGVKSKVGSGSVFWFELPIAGTQPLNKEEADI